MTKFTCTVDGCQKASRNRGSAAMCKMHYHRWYRHGRTEIVATTLSTRTDESKYRSLHLPSHPAAPPCGRIYEHRAVLFDSIGDGEHPCHWCGAMVSWASSVGETDYLTVDHLNSVRDDNRLDNLVVSCNPCNVARSMTQRHERLVEAGWWASNDTAAPP